AWIMGQKDLAKMRDGLMDESGRGNTQTGWICGMIGTILNGLILIGGILFLIIWVGFQGASFMSTPTGSSPWGPSRNFRVDPPPLQIQEVAPPREIVVPAGGEESPPPALVACPPWRGKHPVPAPVPRTTMQ